MKADRQVTLANRSDKDDLNGMAMVTINAKGFHMTSHAIERSQQRCIPPLIIHWLCQYGTRK
ncbi:MAG: hypothetical protein KJO03_04580, partial [Gammaproteobacteria bacterium]|nr:hypothetical protein [Gammaproteobacteria bacterium]